MGEKFQLHYNKPWIMQRADPYIYRHVDGVYYFTASVPTYDSIVLRRSYTLEGLQTAEEKEIWHKHESGIMSEHVWAPELHYLDGKWYHLDLTWNDPISDTNITRDTYFLITTRQLEELKDGTHNYDKTIFTEAK